MNSYSNPIEEKWDNDSCKMYWNFSRDYGVEKEDSTKTLCQIVILLYLGIDSKNSSLKLSFKKMTFRTLKLFYLNQLQWIIVARITNFHKIMKDHYSSLLVCHFVSLPSSFPLFFPWIQPSPISKYHINQQW